MPRFQLSVIVLLLMFSSPHAQAADSVDVYFNYKPPGNPNIVYLPGEFNNWANNAQGVIYPNVLWNMTKDSITQVWYKWQRLRVGGVPGGRVPGAYQYKFNETGCSTCWLNDPLNQHINLSDNSNSYIYIKDPTIYHLLPNERKPDVNTSVPLISAYIFPKVNYTLDTSSLSLTIDGVVHTNLGSYYNFSTKQFVYTPSPLPNGSHTVILAAGTNADTATFTTRSGFVQLLNVFPFITLKSSWTLNGLVTDSNVTTAKIIRNSADTFTVPVANKIFTYSAPLVEGSNSFVAAADSAGTQKVSSPVIINRTVNHSPWALITFTGPVPDSGRMIPLDATSSTDPDTLDASSMHFLWSSDSTNPSLLSGIDGSTLNHLAVLKPTLPGDYFISLIATDTAGYSDTTRNYFTVRQDGSIYYPAIASNPTWAQEARIYFLFPKAVSAAGTLNAAAQRLQKIKDLGFSVIWLMPVMKNAYPINNGTGPGYNIVDFYHVATEYGTDQDLINFVKQAHLLGIHVILDVTPNHTSRFHPWSVDAHTYKTNSPYWNWYQHQYIPHNENGLGQSADADNFWYYGGFSEQLLNFNWTDIDASHEMINVYKYWIKYFGLDGYRFDVYWGPHRRYGEQYMGKPVRDALKHIKPDILLLAEDDGTGTGTETIYADYASNGINGGVDAAYDFALYFNQIRNFGFSASAITNLHDQINNAGYYPGENALYMRFMESQDEDRIFYTDPSPSTYYNANPDIAFRKTMPMASVLFTAPGLPMLWNGQEVGWGYGISGSKLARNRSVINWDFQGAGILSPHYQKLANIRGQFRAFSQHKKDTNHDGSVSGLDSPDFVHVTSDNSIIYAFGRAYENQNGLTVVNFGDSTQTAVLNLLSGGALKFTGGVQSGTLYYLNNLYANTRRQVLGSALASLSITLPAYGTAVYTVSTTPDSLVIANPILYSAPEEHIPGAFKISQNYPNPFNPVTTIKYELGARLKVNLTVYDIMGRVVTTLVNGEQVAGTKEVVLNASGLASGMYFYRLQAGSVVLTKKLVLLK